jgi:hypothetical protein
MDKAARVTMITTTTNNSVRVKPDEGKYFDLGRMGLGVV